MVAVALVFPGQGSQYVGMGRTAAENSPLAARAFAEADEALGERISRLAWEGPAEGLDLTVNAQPAILATSRALLEVWSTKTEGVLPSPSFYAGHSMGQYSAMVAAGVVSYGDGLRLARRRGELMQASAADGAMAAIIGLDEGRLEELLAAGRAAGTLALANRNAPGQVVISGERAAVERASEAARDLGAKRAIILPVSVAAHSPLMARAAEGMREAIAEVEFHDPGDDREAPLLANADARPLTTADDCRNELIEHLTRGVDWVRAVETMRAAGVDTFVEAGPGKVLTNLIKRIAPEARSIPIDDPSSPDGVHDPAGTAIGAAS